MTYDQFLKRKQVTDSPSGLAVVPPLNPTLFEFQRDIVTWALRRGRAAIFADCGLGKTAMQLEWAKHVPGRVLIVAPLAVAHQTVREGEKFGVAAEYRRDDEPDQFGMSPRIVVTNYEMIERFNPRSFEGIVLDESSILKSYTGKFRNYIVEHWGKVPFRLAATATPAPNDFMELGNHAEFLGVMTRTEMLAMFFVHDGGDTQKWRLKGHAQSEFWQWVCSWAVNLRKPSDLGYDDGAFTLPRLHIKQHTVDVSPATEGMLFALQASTLQERLSARRDTVEARAEATLKLINEYDIGDRQDICEAGIHEAVSRAKSGEVDTDSGEAGGKERETSGALRDRPEVSRADEGGSSRSREGASDQAEDVSVASEIRAQLRQDDANHGGAGLGLRDLRTQGHGRSEHIPACRSLPRNERGSRDSLPELQSSDREASGRSREDDSRGGLRDKWLIWCQLNAEQDLLERLFRGRCVSVRGATPIEKKIEYELAWRTGEVPIMISKPSVFGWGLNWQHCANIVFVGLSDSYEEFYQAVRRCWRFGQTREVHAHVITADIEGAVVRNIERKEHDAKLMAAEMVRHMSEINSASIHGTVRDKTKYTKRNTGRIPSFLAA